MLHYIFKVGTWYIHTVYRVQKYLLQNEEHGMIRESGVASCSCGRAGRAGRALLLYLNYLPSHLYCTDNVCETAYRRLLFFWGRGGGDRGPCIRPISRLAVRAFSLFLFFPSLPSLASSSLLRMESRFMITAYLRCMYSGHNGSAPRQTDWSYHTYLIIV